MLTIISVAVGVAIGLVIDRLIINPFVERRYLKMCEKAGIVPIQWFYRMR